MAGPPGDVSDPLSRANRAFAGSYPGKQRPASRSTPSMAEGTFSGGITAGKLGQPARRSLEEYGGNPSEFGAALGIPPALAAPVHRRVIEKLEREAVEDFRIDFEDGYGNRSDAEEDRDVAAAAGEVAAAAAEGSLPVCIGIRIKPLNQELRRRATRTLEIFLTTLGERAGRLPSGLVVTLPKITIPEQVSHASGLVARLEQRLGLEPGSVPLELMVEMPQAILDHTGRCPLPSLVAAGEGRVRGAHFGTYDYTMGLSSTAAYQRMGHPACDFAKSIMQVALAGTGAWLSDGATGIMPVLVHRAGEGSPLTAEQRREKPGQRRARLEAPLRRRPPFPGDRLLPGMGSASGPAGHPLRGGLHLFSGRTHGRGRAAPQLPREGGPGHAGGRWVR